LRQGAIWPEMDQTGNLPPDDRHGGRAPSSMKLLASRKPSGRRPQTGGHFPGRLESRHGTVIMPKYHEPPSHGFADHRPIADTGPFDTLDIIFSEDPT